MPFDHHQFLPSDADLLAAIARHPLTTDLTPRAAARLRLWVSRLLAQHRGEPVPEPAFMEQLVTAYLRRGITGLIADAERFEQEKAEKLKRRLDEL